MELPFIVYEEGKLFAEFWILMDLEPTTLDQVIDVFDVHNVNVIKGLVSGDYKKEKRTLHVFIDYTNSTVSIDELSHYLSKVKGVYNVEFRKGFMEGVATSQLDIPPTILGENVVIFRRSTLMSWFARIREIFKTGADMILYEAGVAAGKEAVKFFKENFNLSGRDLIRFMLNYGSVLGWGSLKLKEIDEKEKRAVIRIDNLFECLPFKGKRKEPTSCFMRGYIVGVARQLVGVENIVGEETKCIAKGDPYCEIVVRLA
jgi:hypothetical protein